jgi:hypothetical protein
MLIPYRAIIGAAKMHMFRMSVVGVTMAAMMKITRIEYRKFFHMKTALRIPIYDRKKTRMGISKIRPIPRMMLRNSDVYSPIVIIG